MMEIEEHEEIDDAQPAVEKRFKVHTRMTYLELV
jgi:hypothetical protein